MRRRYARAADVVGGGSGGARDGFGADWMIVNVITVDVIPCSIIRKHRHAVLAPAPVRLILALSPVCERAAVFFH